MKRLFGVCVALLLMGAVLAQLSSNRGPSTAKDQWWANAVFYQVFVRSFQDSNNDGIGDLRGLTLRLDDLASLGVTALWLNPIYPSPSYHGYDITNYTDVNPEYGTLADFDAFMMAAKAHHMRVILDYVPNHSSSQHPWFLESKNPNSPKRNWYIWRDNDPGWRNPLGGSSSPWRAAAQAGGLKVIFPGTIQSALGGKDWDPNGAVTRASESSSGVYELVVRLPEGHYEYKVALNGSWSENYGKNNQKDGANIALEVPKGGAIVKFVFDTTRKRVLDSINNPTEVTAPSSLPPARSFTDTPAQTQYYYAPFWEGMPDLNWRNPEVRTAMFAAAKFWLERGVDGFRVDAVRYLFESATDASPDQPETINWVKDFSAFIRSLNPDAALVTEAWADTQTVSKYFVNGQGEQLGFDFDLMSALRQSANSARGDAVNAVLAKVAASYPPSAVDAVFTSNHDLERMRFFNSGRYRSAAAMLLTLPGTPFIYYGEEIGMPNGNTGNDEAKRTPMRWDSSPTAGFSTVRPWFGFSTDDPKISVSSQRDQAGSLYRLYRNLIRIRQRSEALRVGGYTSVSGGDERVFAYVRATAAQNVVVVINLDSDPHKLKLNLGALRGAVRELSLAKTLAPVTAANASSYPLQLSPYGFVLLEVKP